MNVTLPLACVADPLTLPLSIFCAFHVEGAANKPTSVSEVPMLTEQ